MTVLSSYAVKHLDPASPAVSLIGHNGGPPLDDEAGHEAVYGRSLDALIAQEVVRVTLRSGAVVEGPYQKFGPFHVVFGGERGIMGPAGVTVDPAEVVALVVVKDRQQVDAEREARKLAYLGAEEYERQKAKAEGRLPRKPRAAPPSDVWEYVSRRMAEWPIRIAEKIPFKELRQKGGPSINWREHERSKRATMVRHFKDRLGAAAEKTFSWGTVRVTQEGRVRVFSIIGKGGTLTFNTTYGTLTYTLPDWTPGRGRPARTSLAVGQMAEAQRRTAAGIQWEACEIVAVDGLSCRVRFNDGAELPRPLDSIRAGTAAQEAA